mmetsp:Transcript_33210/g.33823  ORF Transcript_33210/g.33823 Transcript_33210/m.33823 type:complete len:120 (-) Transcript_33210:77-436(-)
MRMCPDGSEGTSYALLTTFENVAYSCAGAIGNYMATVWDVSNNTLRSHNIDGLWRLTLVLGCISLSPIILIHFLPSSAKEQDQRNMYRTKSPVCGAVFLIVLFGSITWNISVAFNALLQ